MPAEYPNAKAGARFEKVVKIALARHSRIHTMTQLKQCTGLHGNTLYDVFKGDLEDGPTPKTVNLVATCLDIPTRLLWDAWQGREPEPDSTEEALRRHADAVDRQTRLLGELVNFVRSAAGAIVAEPLVDSDEEAEAQERADEASRLRVVPPESEASSEQPAPRVSVG
jgi:lambda repressor-like predicted transcriptional regulator